MTVPSQGGVFSFGLQAAKIGAGNTFDPSVVNFYKMRAPRIALGLYSDDQIFPLETGGPLTPSGAYRQAEFFAGQVDLIPRLQNNIGFIFKALMGSASTVTGKDPDGTTLANVNSHLFRFDPTSAYNTPWCTARRLAPAAIGSPNLGETGYDAKVTSLRLTVPAMGKLACTVTMVGRDTQVSDASTWTYSNAVFEDSLTTPDAGRGQFQIAGVSYPALGATIDFSNGMTTPQQEMVIGSFNPDDFVPLTRGVTIRFVYKVQDWVLYKTILTGTGTGTVWQSLPFITTQAGAVYAFDARFRASTNIPSTSTPYELRVRAASVTWRPEGPPELVAGGFVTQVFVGTVLDPAAGDYAQITLENAATAY